MISNPDPASIIESDEPPDIPPTRPHPAWIISAVIDTLRNLIFAFIALVFAARDRGAFAVIVLSLLFGLVIVVWRVMQWRVSFYSAQDGAVTLRTGLLEKKERMIRRERVQSVDTIQTPIDQLLNVQQLKVMTAGTSESIVIPAVSLEESEMLKRWLAADLAESRAAASPESGEVVATASVEPEFRLAMSPREVVLAGVTSGRVAPALAIAAAGWRLLTELLPESIWERIPVDPGRLTPTTIVAVIGFAAILAWGLSIAGAVLTYWGFTMERRGDRLVVSSGLLDRRQNTIPVQRVQAVTIVDGILRQPFGFASVEIESAARKAWHDEEEAVRHLVPFIRRESISEMMNGCLPEFAWSDDQIAWSGLPPRALRRYLLPVVRDGLLLTVIVCLVLSQLPIGAWWYGLAIVPFIPMLLIHALFQFRDAAWSYSESIDRLFLRRRGIDRRTTATSARRLHMRELASSWFQRRAGLATLTVRLASSGSDSSITLEHIDHQTGDELLNRLEYASPR